MAVPHARARALFRHRDLAAFPAYGRQRDFVGMDMARKVLQMGFTRARRYAKRKGGRKYANGSRRLLPLRAAPDPVKAEAAKIFYAAWRSAATDPLYVELKGLFLAAQSKKRNPHMTSCARRRARPESGVRGVSKAPGAKFKRGYCQ